MPFDFPASPTTGQVFNAPTGQGYVWNGTAWNLAQTSPQAPVASDVPPSSPYAGQLWFKSSTGLLYMWYVDANSSQWVQIPGGNMLSDPYPFNVADMQLVSMAAGVVGLNSKKDGSGSNTKLWTDANNPAAISSPGYHKFASGLIMNYGVTTTDSGGNQGITFPTAFPNAVICCVATVTTGSSVIGANVTYPVTCCLVSKTSVSWQARTVSTSVAGMASGIVYWIVLGF